MAVGFRSKSKKTKKAKVRDYNSAIALAELEKEVVDYGDFDDDELVLPLGLYLPTGDSEGEEQEESSTLSWERLQTFTFKDGIDSGSYELALERKEGNAKNDFGKHLDKVAWYLGEIVLSIGEVEISEIASRLGCQKVDIFKRMFTGDIMTLCFAARAEVQGSRDYAVRTKCKCNKAKLIQDNLDTGLHNLNGIQFTFLSNEEFPLFKVTLPNGFNDGEKLIKDLYIEPLRLTQTAKLENKTVDSTDRTVLLQEMCVGIPDSEVYGLGKSRMLTPKVLELFDKQDRRYLDVAAGEMTFGPIPTISVTCPLCIDPLVFDDYINWLGGLKDFIYASGADSVVKIK